MERQIRIDRVELVEVVLPLVRPFRTSFGEQRDRHALLVHVTADGVEGWVSEEILAVSPALD